MELRNKELSICMVVGFVVLTVASAGNFYTDVDITFGDGRAKIINPKLMSLTMDQGSGSGFKSKREFLFGRFDMQIKLHRGHTAGTVTTFYLISEGQNHDEIDFEFLGNVTGQPYALRTNVFAKGVGLREQDFYLWFDPTQNFHTYSIVWMRHHIVWLVDNIPIRVHKNTEAQGGAYPSKTPMRVYTSIWNGDSWATRGGKDKVNWSKAPFTAYYSNYNAITTGRWQINKLDATSRRKLRWATIKYRIYNYCTNKRLFPVRPPSECMPETRKTL